ncbi:MAG: hypothetical protein VX693_02380 [Pseudomonadota bacterium]|nr:hypothetical protein [Pseudomonadota bacterium]
MFVKNFFVGLVCFLLPILFMSNTHTSASVAETPLLLEVAEAKDKKKSTPEEEEEEEDDC